MYTIALCYSRKIISANVKCDCNEIEHTYIRNINVAGVILIKANNLCIHQIVTIEYPMNNFTDTIYMIYL